MVSCLCCYKHLHHVYFLQCTIIYLYFVYAYFAHFIFQYMNNQMGSVFHILKFSFESDSVVLGTVSMYQVTRN
jgi:hypothetical protein